MNKITINRVKNAIQRSTHLSDKGMWRRYPEFMGLWMRVLSEQQRQEISDRINTRAKEILNENY